ncbi:Endonuclease I [Spironucleus salmonicida]|uniref:Endonuclease I n=1 Tax=Spironucleus salmonicida TaxID=348837 RepID=V6LDV1_9EUKA|nr:Endonuclease I [Spironucleus salmonicida]|eukprot:EST42453.1 Endonuclease I [Spironucleus salmonicida]
MLILLLQEYFSGQDGKTLRKNLYSVVQEGYQKLSYIRSREELYGYIANDPQDNAVHDCYTGLRMECEYESMDTQCNNQEDLNCEHIVPQSLFDQKQPMKSDLYHLRTVWKKSNNARSNYPFQYVKSSEAKSYYGNNYAIEFNKPVDVQNWSILSYNHTFEPRDIQKGDTARAVAYFYVMYPKEFHTLQKTFSTIDDMIEWDIMFPPTDLQIQQSIRTQHVQGNINPFMFEINLVFRAYCDLSEGKYPCQ